MRRYGVVLVLSAVIAISVWDIYSSHCRHTHADRARGCIAGAGSWMDDVAGLAGRRRARSRSGWSLEAASDARAVSKCRGKVHGHCRDGQRKTTRPTLRSATSPATAGCRARWWS